jgi:hypothetical protein
MQAPVTPQTPQSTQSSNFAASHDEFRDNLAGHHMAMDALTRAYFGCNDEAISTATCNEALGNLDRKAYLKARKTARRLFDFQD